MAPKPRVFFVFGACEITYAEAAEMLGIGTQMVRSMVNDQFRGDMEAYLRSKGIRNANELRSRIEEARANAAVDAICDVLKDAKPKLNVSADDAVEVEVDDRKPSNEDDLGAEAEVRYAVKVHKPTPEEKEEQEKNGGISSMTMDEAITNISECLGKVFNYGRQEERAAKDEAIEATPEGDVPDAEITYTAGEIEDMVQKLIKRDIPQYTARQHKLIKLNQAIRLLDDEDVVEMCEAHGVNNISVAAFDLKTVRMNEFGGFVNWDEMVRFVED